MRRRVSAIWRQPSTNSPRPQDFLQQISVSSEEGEELELDEEEGNFAMAFDEVSSPVLAFTFSKLEFDPDKYVKELVAKCDIKKLLLEERHKIQKLSDETAVSMKKNVYRNYKQFIDTSKEISYLEAEMYQLSHMLTEKKALINAQVEMNIFGNEDEKEGTIEDAVERGENRRGKKLIEIIDGCKDVIAGRREGDICHQGELTEIDPDSYKTIRTIELLSLKDFLVIATNDLTSDSTAKFKFKAMFDLNDVGIVNVRDGGGVRNSFKLLNGLDTWMFGAKDKEMKLKWLEILQDAKKNYEKVEYIPLTPRPQKRQAPLPPAVNKPTEEKAPMEITKPFPDLLNVHWLVELPHDLDMCIAERSFETAVKLVEKANEYLKDFNETPALKEYKEKLNVRVRLLIERLEQSLDNSTSVRHVSLRSIRQFVSLLIRLGRGKLACELFLRNRGFALKHSFRQLKIEGSTSLYITKLANVFFASVVETGKEFRKIFSKGSSASAFVVWAHKELQHFVVLFVRQVFSRKSSLVAISVCIDIANQHCKKLCEIGLDLAFDMQHMFLEHLMEALFDNRDQLIGRAKHLGTEEEWKPTDYSSDPDEIYTVIGELESLGVTNAYDFATGNHEFLLSKSTVAFTKGALTFFEDGMKLYTTQLHPVFIQCLTDIFKTQALQLEFTIKSEKFTNQLDFILKSTSFIFDCVLAIIEKRLKARIGHEVEVLRELHEELPRLEKIASVKRKRTQVMV
eukprot:gene15166-16725_t